MKLKWCLLFVFFLLGLPTVQAGFEHGNGGDVVYCYQEGGVSVEMLDLYEAVSRWGLTIDFGPPELSPLEKVNFVLDRLEAVDPYRAQEYRQRAGNFFTNALFLPGINLILPFMRMGL